MLLHVQAVNPTFCKFNQAQIASCDMGLCEYLHHGCPSHLPTRPVTELSLPTDLGDTTATVNATGVAGGVNSTTLHLRGQKVLAAQLATLAKLGMAGATEILVTGTCLDAPPLTGLYLIGLI